MLSGVSGWHSLDHQSGWSPGWRESGQASTLPANSASVGRGGGSTMGGLPSDSKHFMCWEDQNKDKKILQMLFKLGKGWGEGGTKEKKVFPQCSDSFI